jgi:hypothetical protein
MDDILLALSRIIPEYVRSVGSFQYKGKMYLLVNNLVSSPYMKCDVCGNYPIIDVSVIRNEDGGRLNACYNCIDRITNQNVSMWFKSTGTNARILWKTGSTSMGCHQY